MSAGLVFLVVGPSGAGKDSLIAGAKVFCTAHSSDKFIFPKRIVTRAQNAFEDHDTLSFEEFAKVKQAGAFALSWEAHGLCYGLPTSLDHAVANGQHAILNVSRSIIPLVRQRYKNVRVIFICARDEVLAKRLASRGRDSDIAERLAQSSRADKQVHADIVIDNSDDLASAQNAFNDYLIDAVTALRQ